jgi:hypothetical protein
MNYRADSCTSRVFRRLRTVTVETGPTAVTDMNAVEVHILSKILYCLSSCGGCIVVRLRIMRAQRKDGLA